MGFFKRLSDSSFKVDVHGNTLFYPWGILGRGYVLPDKATEDKIRKFITCYHFVGLILMLTIGVFLMLWDVAFVVLLPVSIIVWCIQARQYIKGLQQTEERLSLKENFKKMFRNGS